MSGNVLSVRTVEGHIHRAMMKTGAASREQLAAIMHQKPGNNP
jgi:DNA-binding CsgD family transcriptional regulator